ncbi:pyridoxal phosphate-dependent aminotransferase [Crenobacter luteus]|uniref:Putative 8-amino-7-oxononanoate synthase n=1 Tax=Crenobacter luteus TaxID=1452487 RepID=A0A165G6D4_9NEIS|nr:pyridoxal phosphate-dependent aminotransferase [Crenobacter luteus]KZE35242.1 aminotransferase [Crenobacter luteus]
MALKLAERMREIAPFRVMAILEAARAREAAGYDVIHLEVGEPDFATPPAIVEAGRRALADGRTFYSAAQGLPELRRAISRWYAERYRVDVSPERILVTPGASGALMVALALLVGDGDEVVMADPTYPCNRHFVSLYGGTPVSVPAGPDSRYQLTAPMLAEAWGARTVAAMVASPANPTGGVLSAAEIKGLAEVCRDRGGALIVDEIYHGLTYGCDAASALQVADDALVINSFSKYFQMTGWRLGWLVVPEALVEPATRLAQNLYLCAPAPAQAAALAAFEADTIALLEERRAEFARRRDFLVDALPRLGWKLPVVPDGAFYLYADVSAVTDDSLAYCARILEEADVAITPGLDFGQHRANTHVRIAYTTGVDRLAEAVERIARLG